MGEYAAQLMVKSESDRCMDGRVWCDVLSKSSRQSGSTLITIGSWAVRWVHAQRRMRADQGLATGLRRAVHSWSTGTVEVPSRSATHVVKRSADVPVGKGSNDLSIQIERNRN
jgi:hypothetical protein